MDVKNYFEIKDSFGCIKRHYYYNRLKFNLITLYSYGNAYLLFL